MYRYIYSLPLRQIVALMLITIPMWAFGQLRQGQSQSSWRALNGALCIVSVLIIASITLFRRSPGAGEVNLIPFSSFVKARTVPEMYREMLMNAMLFFPLGLSLSSALPPRLGIGRRFGLTVLAALGLSFAVELIQLVFKLGLAEVDDLLTNSFGAALGASQLFLGPLLRRLKR